MIDGGVGANYEDHLGLLDIHHRIGHCAGPNTLQQGGHRRGMAKACAVIDIVGTEACTHQLLKQIGFFIAAFGRTKTRQRV